MQLHWEFKPWNFFRPKILAAWTASAITAITIAGSATATEVHNLFDRNTYQTPEMGISLTPCPDDVCPAPIPIPCPIPYPSPCPIPCPIPCPFPVFDKSTQPPQQILLRRNWNERSELIQALLSQPIVMDARNDALIVGAIDRGKEVKAGFARLQALHSFQLGDQKVTGFSPFMSSGSTGSTLMEMESTLEIQF